MTVAKFGDITFPVNPSGSSRDYERAVAAKGWLNGGEYLETRGVHLPKIRLEGRLVGPTAKSIMDSLDAALQDGTVGLLITPSFTGGEYALLNELECEVETIKDYGKYIRYTADFILVSGVEGVVSKVQWDVEAQNSGFVFQAVDGILEFVVEQQGAGVAGAFDVLCDNRNGMNAYPRFDYGRGVRVRLGRVGGTIRRIMWGIIDAIDDDVMKDGGSTVRITGRCFTARLLEGYEYSKTFEEVFPKEIIMALLEGTGIGEWRLPGGGEYSGETGGPDWTDWPSGLPFRISSISFRDETRLECMKKVSDQFSMEFYVDNNDLGFVPEQPQLVWYRQPMVQLLSEDGVEGNDYVKVSDASYWLKPGGSLLGKPIWIADGDNYELTALSSIDIITNTLYLNSALDHTYQTSRGALISNSKAVLPIVKEWGVDVIGFGHRFSGIPLRNRVEVYGDGCRGIADTDNELLELYPPDAASILNRGRDSVNSTKYTERTLTLNDKSFKHVPDANPSGAARAAIMAMTELLKRREGEKELRLRIIGDVGEDATKTLTPGRFFVFLDGGVTGRQGTYKISQVIQRVNRFDGWITEVVLRTPEQSAGMSLFSDVIKGGAKDATGSANLFESTPLNITIGEVISP